MKIIKSSTLWAGPFSFLLLLFLGSYLELTHEQSITLGITLWCAIWWVSEAVPVAVTSLLPLALLPLTGVLTGLDVAKAYGHPLILLLMGGFILSKSLERSGTHKRIALMMIHQFGASSPARLIAGFMAASAVLSMWISNTATTLMLLPVALAILSDQSNQAFKTALLLGIAYAASIGGIGTPIGTPPNMLFKGIYEQATGIEISFTQWMSWGVPVVIIFVPLAWLWLTRKLSSNQPLEIPELGAWRAEEKRVLIVFLITALLWMTRSEPFGGWSDWFNLPSANDASVALLAVVSLFIIPNGKGEKLLDWPTANSIPWGVLILFGGGIALAEGFQSSGLSQQVGNVLASWIENPLWLVIPVICLSVTFITEVTSNTATTTLLMPILAAAGLAAGIDPALIMVPAAMSASCAFMLPVATAPNAVVFGSEQVTIAEMAKNGFVLNLIGVLVISGSVLMLMSA